MELQSNLCRVNPGGQLSGFLPAQWGVKKQRSLLIESCLTCPFRSKAVLCDLNGDDWAVYEKIKQSVTYEARQTVFYEGHTVLALYLLCAGKVKLTRSSRSGGRQIVDILEGGNVIEKRGFRPHAVHEVTCETLEPSQICLIDKEAFFDLMRRNADLAVKVIKLLSREIGVRLDQLDLFTFQNARQRLASLLLNLSQRFGKPNGNGIHLEVTLSRKEMAEVAAVSVKTAIRLLGAFRDKGLICMEGREITLLNPDRLARIARL